MSGFERRFPSHSYIPPRILGENGTRVPEDHPGFRSVVARGLLIQGWKTQEELAFLARLAYRAPRILDVGCWRGQSTKVFTGARLLSAIPGSIVVAVDHLSRPFTGEWARNQILGETSMGSILREFMDNLAQELAAGLVVAIFQDGVEARSAVEKITGGQPFFDLVFLDGDHGYEETTEDILAYAPLIRPGGILAGHDLDPSFPGVVRAVTELVTSPKCGPGSIWFAKKT